MKKMAILAIVLLMPVSVMAANIADSHSQDFGCGACHSAHGSVAPATGSAAPLWGRALTTETLVAYEGGSALDVITPGVPAGDSKMCMSCHDGVSNTSGTGAVGSTKDDGKVDTNKSHPISFQYDTMGGDFNSEPTSPVKLVGSSSDQVECSSCHDIHGASLGSPALITATTTALCNACHVK